MPTENNGSFSVIEKQTGNKHVAFQSGFPFIPADYITR